MGAGVLVGDKSLGICFQISQLTWEVEGGGHQREEHVSESAVNLL